MRKNYHVVENWWQPAFTEYTPSRDIAEAFEAMSEPQYNSRIDNQVDNFGIDEPYDIDEEENDDE